MDGVELGGEVAHVAELFEGQAGHPLDLRLEGDGLVEVFLDLALEGGPLGLVLVDHRAVILEDPAALVELLLDGLDLFIGLGLLGADPLLEVALDVRFALEHVLELRLDLLDHGHGIFDGDVLVSHLSSPFIPPKNLGRAAFLTASGVKPRLCNLFFFFIL